MKTFVLVGNQNSGKTTLFNSLTGMKQRTGNYPGITVEYHQGMIKNHADLQLIDLPGIYSLSCFSNEEIIARNYLFQHSIDCIINIIDVSNLQRSLYLTLQLMTLNIKMVIGLNMMDDLKHQQLSVPKLTSLLNIPCIPICAIRKEGLDELITAAIQANSISPIQIHHDLAYDDYAYSMIQVIHKSLSSSSFSLHYVLDKFLEKDLTLFDELHLKENEIQKIQSIITHFEQSIHNDNETYIAMTRYRWIEHCYQQVISNTLKHSKRSFNLDSILLNSYFSFPFLIFSLFLVFSIPFGSLGTALRSIFSTLLTTCSDSILYYLDLFHVHSFLQSLIADGILNGITSVLDFLPLIILLYLCLSILEESGYMTRIAFLLDRPARSIGLSGKSFLPLLTGFGCSVPAILSTRSCTKRDQILTIFMIHFISCSAKIPVYLFFVSIFFPDHSVMMIVLLYSMSIFLGFLVIWIINRKIMLSSSPFIMELPPYRLPSLKNTLIYLNKKVKEFLTKAFTIIYLSSILIWFLQHFTSQFIFTYDTSLSILADLSHHLLFIFQPLGFSDWRLITALLTGLSAKEVILSTLVVLFNSDISLLPVLLSSILTPLSAFSFLIFVLLYTPCIASISICTKELGFKYALFMICMQLILAWLVAFGFYQIGNYFI